MTDDERIPDEFEETARAWAAQEGIIETCASFVEHFDLDSELQERPSRGLHVVGGKWDGDVAESPFIVALPELLKAVQAVRSE